jgi:hypothetical protein
MSRDDAAGRGVTREPGQEQNQRDDRSTRLEGSACFACGSAAAAFWCGETTTLFICRACAPYVFARLLADAVPGLWTGARLETFTRAREVLRDLELEFWQGVVARGMREWPRR